ncbi:MAG: nucleotidyltransferase substrate binding protein [Magnetococcales bacterium]|nr:nucleotidyltransferase substrate binding protein [Magnetococcales bacterium]
MDLDISSFSKAVERLSEGLEELGQYPELSSIRDGVIQRFEFTYELAHKTLRRYLSMSVASKKEIDEMAFPDLIRTGNEQGLLLSDWPVWKSYRQSRNDTSYAYDEEKAQRVMDKIPAFLKDSRFLLEQLQKRIGKT